MLDIEKIERLRDKAGLSQTEAGKRIGMSRQGWSNIITGSGNVSMKVLDRIAAALGTKSKNLLIDD